MNPLNLPGPQFLAFYAVVLVAAVIVGRAIRASARRGAGGPAGRPPDLGPYELAYLADGPTRVVQAALVALAGRGAVVAGPGGTLSAGAWTPASPGLRPDPIEAAVHQAVRQPAARFNRVAAGCRSALRSVEHRLVGAGLLVSPANRALARLLVGGLMTGVLVLGVAKAAIGAERERPIAFLVIGCLVALVALLWLVTSPLRRTAAGDAVLSDWSSRNRRLDVDAAARSNDNLMLGVALFGPSLLAGTALAEFQAPLRPQPAGGGGGGGDSSGSGCGSGDGGGGGSCGGGGGCGGCGGGGD